MPRIDQYWLDPDPQGPYATFLSIMQSYLHPEAYDLEGLQEDARRTSVSEWATFKREFREIVANPRVLPEDALCTAAGYDDGSDEAFLARVWRELYGDELP